MRESFSRFIALNEVSHLPVSDNVVFRVPGHNIYLASGAETNNIIERNLIISPMITSNMLNSDLTAAGIYITNP